MKKILLITIIVTIFPIHAFSQEDWWSKFEKYAKDALNKGGQVLFIEKDKEGHVRDRTIAMLANAPLEKVWKVLINFEKYKEFVPEMKKSTITQKKGDEYFVDHEVLFKFVISFSHPYKSRYLLEKPKVWLLNYEKGTKDGFWELLPSEDGKKTLIIYKDKAPELESFGTIVRQLINMKPDLELALQISPPSVYVEAMKARSEGNK